MQIVGFPTWRLNFYLYFFSYLFLKYFSECTRQPQQSKSQDPGVNAAAIGGGVGGALALLGLIIAAAALYRHFKRKSSVDDLSNAASQTGAAGATGVTPVVKIEDAPNSIPPAGTN